MKKFASLQIRSRGATKTEKLTAKCEDHDFCELWKRDVRTLEAALRRLFLNVFAIARPPLKYYSLKLFCKFGERARRRTQRILTFGKNALLRFISFCRKTDSASRSSDSTRCQQDHLRPPTVAKSVPREKKKNNIDNITEAINLTRESENSAAEGCRSHQAKAYI